MAAALNHSLPLSDGAWRPRFNPWLISLTMTLATFMEAFAATLIAPRAPFHQNILAGHISNYDPQYLHWLWTVKQTPIAHAKETRQEKKEIRSLSFPGVSFLCVLTSWRASEIRIQGKTE